MLPRKPHPTHLKPCDVPEIAAVSRACEAQRNELVDPAANAFVIKQGDCCFDGSALLGWEFRIVNLGTPEVIVLGEEERLDVLLQGRIDLAEKLLCPDELVWRESASLFDESAVL